MKDNIFESFEGWCLSNIKKIRRNLFILIIVLMIMIFWFSARNADESSNQSGLLLKIVLDLTPELKKVDTSTLVLFLRKGAHMFEYFVLCIVTVSYILTFEKARKNRKWLFMALFVCLFYASTDEFHQRFVPGRWGCVTDVCVDLTGATIGFLLYMLMLRIYRLYRNGLIVGEID
ncbi:MAG: VanZ family protein [Lachnospiraceae bacterium]|nr:VanZ family protein [Lachnospiraceae bacterium]